MFLSKAIRTSVVAASVFLAGCSMTGSVEKTIPAGAVKNIVMVHGAWADGSSWAKVIPLLQKHGFHVVAVQNPLTSLADDAAATKRAIALQDGPVILVGHSYGGAVITEAGTDPKVVGLVYVAAFAPDEGQSALEQGKPYPTPGGSEIRPDAEGFLLLTLKGISEDFAQDLSETEKHVMVATQGPTSVKALTAKLSNTAWKTKRTWFIVAKNDRMISPVQERESAAKMKAETTELVASHVAMLARPVEVDAVIEKAAMSFARK